MAKKKTIIETAELIDENIEVAVPEKITAKVIGGKALNIRAKASLSADKVGELKDGSKVEILSKGEDWCEIAGGFIKTEFLAF